MKNIPMAALALMLMSQQVSAESNTVTGKALVKSSPAPLSKDPKHVKASKEVAPVESPEDIAKAAKRDRLLRNVDKWLGNQKPNKIPTTRDGFRLKVTLAEQRNPDKEYEALCYAEAIVAACLNQEAVDKKLVDKYVADALAINPNFNKYDPAAMAAILPPYLQNNIYLEKDTELLAFHNEQLSVLRDMRDGIAYEFKVVKCEIVHSK